MGFGPLFCGRLDSFGLNQCCCDDFQDRHRPFELILNRPYTGFHTRALIHTLTLHKQALSSHDSQHAGSNGYSNEKARAAETKCITVHTRVYKVGMQNSPWNCLHPPIVHRMKSRLHLIVFDNCIRQLCNRQLYQVWYSCYCYSILVDCELFSIAAGCGWFVLFALMLLF